MLNTKPGAKFYCSLCQIYTDLIGSHEIPESLRPGATWRICPNCWTDMINEYWAEYDAIHKPIRDKYWAEIEAARHRK